MRHFAVEPAIEDLTRGFLNKEDQWIEVAIESYRECDKKKLKSSIGRIAIKRYQDY